MKRLTISIVLLVLVGILPCLWQYGYFLIATDFAAQEIPFIVETKRMLSSGIPFWSWNHYIGDNFIGCYSFYTLTSPFVWFCCLFPYDQILMGITIALFLKMLCTGWFSYFYFRKMNLTADLSVIGGLMYAFSSWSISNLFYYHFLEPMMCFPVFLIGIELFLRKEKYGEIYLILSTFLIAFINFYFLPCSVIGGCLYALMRVSSNEINFGLKRFVEAGIYLAFGILLASFVLFPTIIHLQGNERIGMNFGIDEIGFYNIIERVRSLFAPKLLEEPNELLKGTGWNSNAAHIPVIGVMLSSLYCIKNHRNWLTYLIISSILLYITPLNGIFSFFTNPIYSRWAYVLTLFIILGSLKFLAENSNVPGHVVIYYSILSFVVIALSYGINYFSGKSTPTIIGLLSNILILSVFFFNLLLLLIYYKHQTIHRLFICVCLSTIVYMPLRLYMRTDAFFKFNPQHGLSGYINRYILDNKLQRENGEYFFRTDFVTRKNNIYQNLPLLLNRPGVSSFSSVINSQSKKLLSIADSTHFFAGNQFNLSKDVIAFDALCSVKKIIVYHDPLQVAVSRNKDVLLLDSNSRLSIYDNQNFIPMGFTYDSYIDRCDLESYAKENPDSNIMLQMLANIAIDTNDIENIDKLMKNGTIANNLRLDSLVKERKSNICDKFCGDTHGFTAEVDMKRTNLLFFSIPYDKGFTATVDGSETRIYQANIGLSAIIVNKGKHLIRFEYFPRGLKEGCIISLCLLVLLSFFYLIRNYI